MTFFTRGRTALGVFVILSAGVVKTLRDAGAFKCLEFTPAPHCKHVATDIIGCEDAQFLSDGTFLVTSDDRRLWLTAPNPLAALTGLRGGDKRGGIYAVRARDAPKDTNNGDDGIEKPYYWPLALEGYPHEHFHPHGLSIWNAGRKRLAGGEEVVFVVSHAPEGDAVLRFTLRREGDDQGGAKLGRPVALVFRESVPGWQLNDVAATGPRSFFASSWLFFRHGSLLNKLENYLQLKLTRVSRCEPPAAGDGDGDITCAPATKDEFAMSNGVAVSPDGSLLYIAETIKRAVHVYRIQATGLQHLETINTEMGVDNIDIDQVTGDVYVAGHPQLLRWTEHAHDALVPSPSEVVRISMLEGASQSRRRAFRYRKRAGPHARFTWESILMLDGTEFEKGFSAASIAALGDANDLLVGAVFSGGLLHCDMNSAPERSKRAALEAMEACPYWKRFLQ